MLVLENVLKEKKQNMYFGLMINALFICVVQMNQYVSNESA